MKIKTACVSVVTGILCFGVLTSVINLINLSSANEVRAIWFEFEDNRNEKMEALVTLRSELGYLGMIHHFKNYILRQRKQDADQIVATIGGAKLALKKYKSMHLSSSEEESLLIVEKNINSYNNALSLVLNLVEENKTAEEIDRLVNIDDQPILDALLTLDKYAHLSYSYEEETTEHYLNGLRSLMGFGGFIHHYKNYILRGDAEVFSLAMKDLSLIKQHLKVPAEIKLNNIEKNSLKNIEQVILEYEKKLLVIKKLISEGKSARDIDKVVIVDDYPAIKGFRELGKQAQLKLDKSSVEMYEALAVIQVYLKTSFVLTIAFVVGLIFLTSWLVFREIISPVYRLTKVMTQLAEDNLDVEVYALSRTTEIGDMARSVEVFKSNAIKKTQMEIELKQHNEKLEELVIERTKDLMLKEARFTSLVENAVDAIITTDGVGNVLSFNAAANKMFGYNQDEIIGENIRKLIPESYRGDHDRFMSEYNERGIDGTINITPRALVERKNKESFPAEISLSEMTIERGKKLFTIVIRDITEKTEWENSLRKSRDTAEKANKAKSQFLASMSHELRTPLNAIIGFSQLIQISDDRLSQEQAENVEEILNAGHLLLHLINDVLDLARIESGKLDIVMDDVQLNDIIEQSVTLSRSQADARSIEIVNNCSTDRLIVRADPTRFTQILLNFLSNAIKYNNDNGKVFIDTKIIDNKRVRVSVKDTGKGLNDEQLQQLFVPFKRLNTVDNIGGTGIGLVITKHLIELMDGSIGVESIEGEGCAFWVELKLSDR